MNSPRLDDKSISFNGLVNTITSPPNHEFVGELTGNTLETLLNIEGDLSAGFVDRMTASNYTCENTLKRIERQRSKAAASLESEVDY